MKQLINEEWFTVKDSDEFWKNIGLFSPLLVETQPEFDYLWAMQLMIGKEFTVLLNGRDENPTDIPPTHVKIDIPL
jgi:hypothetical protein